MSEEISWEVHTLSVTSAWSIRCRRVLAILMPMCFFLRWWKLISAALSPRRPLEASVAIQWAVRAKYNARLEFDQMSDIKLICPLDCCWLMSIYRFGDKMLELTGSSCLMSLNDLCQWLIMASLTWSQWGISWLERVSWRTMHTCQNLGHSTTQIDWQLVSVWRNKVIRHTWSSTTIKWTKYSKNTCGENGGRTHLIASLTLWADASFISVVQV